MLLHRKFIYIPTTVLFEVKSVTTTFYIWVSGPFGILQNFISNKIKLAFKQANLRFTPNWMLYKIKALLWSGLTLLPELTTKLISLQKMVVSTSVGFKKYLRVRGVGYSFLKAENVLTIEVGFSHALIHILHPELQYKTTRKFRMIRLKSKGLVTVSNTVSFLRNLRQPDVYKGKGIRYRRDPVFIKEGKKRKL